MSVSQEHPQKLEGIKPDKKCGWKIPSNFYV